MDYEEDEDDQEEQVYSVENCYILDKYGTYYQTYGGGPEGGYFLYKKNWYAVERTWFKPWTMTPCTPRIYTPQNEMIGITASIRSVVFA
jgi:hypothetical protein